MSMMFNGKFVVLSLFVLTGIVGALFVYIGPKALQTNPGVFHLGIRYADEFGMEFTRHPKGGPGALLEIIDSLGQTIERFEGLVIGRNLIPIDASRLSQDSYLLRVSANGYHQQVIPAKLINKTLSPTMDSMTLNEDSESIEDFYDFTFKDNLLGIRLYPISSSVQN